MKYILIIAFSPIRHAMARSLLLSWLVSPVSVDANVRRETNVLATILFFCRYFARISFGFKFRHRFAYHVSHVICVQPGKKVFSIIIYSFSYRHRITYFPVHQNNLISQRFQRFLHARRSVSYISDHCLHVSTREYNAEAKLESKHCMNWIRNMIFAIFLVSVCRFPVPTLSRAT